jgi:hypothetical protein
MRLREGEQVKPSPQASSAARVKSPHFEPVILNEVKDPCISSLFFLSAARYTYFDSAMKQQKSTLKRKPTQRGGGCCVGIPVKQRSGWTSL